jgi:hypothetical protein
MKNWQSFVKQVRKAHSEDEIRLMFVNRENDEMFAKVGKSANIGLKDELQQVWFGFEILTRNKTLNDKFRI